MVPNVVSILRLLFRLIISGCDDGSVYCWSMESPSPQYDLRIGSQHHYKVQLQLFDHFTLIVMQVSALTLGALDTVMACAHANGELVFRYAGWMQD